MEHYGRFFFSADAVGMDSAEAADAMMAVETAAVAVAEWVIFCPCCFCAAAAALAVAAVVAAAAAITVTVADKRVHPVFFSLYPLWNAGFGILFLLWKAGIRLLIARQ